MQSEDVVAYARECLGTPFHHQGRVVGKDGGLDCVGVLIHIAKRCGRTPQDKQAYPRTGDGAALRRCLADNGLSLLSQEEDHRAGDVLLFRVDSRRSPGHVGVRTSDGLVQALWKLRCCEIAYPDDLWLDRFVEAWRFPNG